MFHLRNRSERMKGICLIWSRGRHFSPSLPGDRYLKLGSKSDLRAEISESIVGYEALAPRPEVLRSVSCFYGNSLLWVFCLRNRKYPRSSNVDRIGVIGRVISHFKIILRARLPRIVRQDVLLAINCVNNKRRETLEGLM